MKVWLAPSSFFPDTGGVEELTAQLGHHLGLRQHDVTVIVNQWPADLPRSEELRGLTVRRVPYTTPARRPRSWWHHLRQRSTVDSLLDSFDPPDLVHVQCASNQVSYLTRYCNRHGLPLVISTQGETHMDSQQIYQHNPVLRRTLRRSADAASALTACSTWTRGKASEIAPAFSRATVVLNAVTPEEFAVPPRPERPVFGAWGRHVSQKGFDLLLQAFEAVRAELPEAELLLGGHGPETARLEAAAGPGVRFLGPLDRAGVRDLLSASRVVVVPSRLEPFGIVALEALAAGRGLVWSEIGGLAEATNGLGRHVDPHDTTSLSNAMLEEHRDPLDSAQAQRWSAEQTWEHAIQLYEAIYQDVLVYRASSR